MLDVAIDSGGGKIAGSGENFAVGGDNQYGRKTFNAIFAHKHVVLLNDSRKELFLSGKIRLEQNEILIQKFSELRLRKCF